MYLNAGYHNDQVTPRKIITAEVLDEICKILHRTKLAPVAEHLRRHRNENPAEISEFSFVTPTLLLEGNKLLEKHKIGWEILQVFGGDPRPWIRQAVCLKEVRQSIK